MTQEINLKELEKKAFRSYHEDGLWDIFLGLILMAIAVNAFLSKIGVPELQTMVVFVGLEMVAIIFLIVGKKHITAPRIGHVKFGAMRRAKLTKVRIVLALSVIFGLVALVAGVAMQGDPSGVVRPGILFPLVWMVTTLIVFGLMAYFMDFPRLYIIAILYAATVPITEVLIEFVGIAVGYIVFGIAAAIILVMGLVRLFNFFWGLGLWRRRLTAEDTEGTESCCFLCVLCALCALCGFPTPFQKIIKSPGLVILSRFLHDHPLPAEGVEL